MLSLGHYLSRMFVRLQMELGRWINGQKQVFRITDCYISVSLWGLIHSSQDVADSVHVGWWACDRDSCYTLWSWQDNSLCFEPSGLCYELSVLLHWQVKNPEWKIFSWAAYYSVFESWCNVCSLSDFCRMGLKRNLTAAEIVEQAVYARRLLSHEVGSITNVVFMVCMRPYTCLAVKVFSSSWSLYVCFLGNGRAISQYWQCY